MIYWLPILTVLVGYILVLWLKPKKNLGVTLLLAFSGSFLLATRRLLLHLEQVHMGKGVPQTRSRLMHHGLPSFRKARNRFFGSSK